jgi:hypothetical protein
MITKLDPSRLDWCRFFIHLRNVNLCHFRMVEAFGLKVVF